MDDLAGRHLGLDCIEEADELLMRVPAHVAPDHAALEDVQRGGRAWWCRCAWLGVVVPAHPFLNGRPGWVPAFVPI